MAKHNPQPKHIPKAPQKGQKYKTKNWALLPRAIGFYNTYHLIWALIEQWKTPMHCRNTTFIYHNEFSKYMNVEGVISEDVFDYFFDVGTGKFLSEKGK